MKYFIILLFILMACSKQYQEYIIESPATILDYYAYRQYIIEFHDNKKRVLTEHVKPKKYLEIKDVVIVKQKINRKDTTYHIMKRVEEK